MKLVISTIVLLLVFALLPHDVNAQTAPPAPGAAASASTTASAPTTEYTLPPDKLAKAKALYDTRGTLRIIGTVWGFVVLLGLLYLGIVAKYRDWAEKASKTRFVQALIVVPLLMLTLEILDLPLDAYEQSISLKYGLSVQHWGSWFADLLKGEALAIFILIFVFWFLLWLIRKSPRRWWLYAWLIALPFIVLLSMIQPVLIAPLFNKFEPLAKTNPQLVQALEKVSQRGGLVIPPDRMFLMKASEKVTTLNAYVSGFGPSKRVVVWDTTIQKATTPETLFVFGHEMGHYVLHHIYYGLAAAALGLLLGLYVLYLTSGWLLRKFQERWRIRELSDWAALPMIFLVFSVLGFISQPLGNTFSRHLEHNADVYGLEVTHGINANSQEVAARTFQVLGELSYDYPYPSKFVVFWYYNHPSIAQRVRFAHNYDPWDKGESPKYVK